MISTYPCQFGLPPASLRPTPDHRDLLVTVYWSIPLTITGTVALTADNGFCMSVFHCCCCRLSNFWHRESHLWLIRPLKQFPLVEIFIFILPMTTTMAAIAVGEVVTPGGDSPAF